MLYVLHRNLLRICSGQNKGMVSQLGQGIESHIQSHIQTSLRLQSNNFPYFQMSLLQLFELQKKMQQ